MGRIIKFRAWDTRGEIMVYPSPHMNPLYLTLKGNLVEIDREGDELPALNYVLMQFTGLLDKNGKEIYEGDIVQFDMPLAGKPQIRQIIYSTKHAAFVVSTGDYFPKEDWNVGVIGNIHQNPELIGVK